jgi:plasmid stability protein
MSAVNIRKLFRESHREMRLGPLRPGHSVEDEVRPLALTLRARNFITVKDLVARTLHEESIPLGVHAPSLS